MVWLDFGLLLGNLDCLGLLWFGLFDLIVVLIVFIVCVIWLGLILICQVVLCSTMAVCVGLLDWL